jgi:hypothetical protein
MKTAELMRNVMERKLGKSEARIRMRWRRALRLAARLELLVCWGSKQNSGLSTTRAAALRVEGALLTALSRA